MENSKERKVDNFKNNNNQIIKKDQKGKVKWFNIEKGYGFITNNENVDFYFGVKDIVGADLPEQGDIVMYDSYIGKENTEASKNIIIYEKKNPDIKKFKCSGCGREVEPKPWFYGGSDYTNVNVELICPFCAHKILKTGGGFNLFAKIILIIFTISLLFVIFRLT